MVLPFKVRRDVSLAGLTNPTFEIDVYESLCGLFEEMNVLSAPVATFA